MIRIIFWIFFAVVGIFFIWAIWSLKLDSLYHALSYHSSLPLPEVKKIVSIHLQHSCTSKQTAPSLGSLDSFISQKESLACVYLLLLSWRWQALSIWLLVALPFILVLIYDLYLMRKIKSYALVYMSNLEKQYYFYQLYLSCLVVVILFLLPYALDIKFIYFAGVLILISMYKLRLNMHSSYKQEAIS